MIWGKTDAHKAADFADVHKAFAWLPRKIIDGRWIWLEPFFYRKRHDWFWADGFRHVVVVKDCALSHEALADP